MSSSKLCGEARKILVALRPVDGIQNEDIVARMLNQALRDHIPEFFSLEYDYYTYEKNVQPVNVMALEAQATDSCLPPILKRGRGRPRTRRIRKGERQLRREQSERQGLLPDIENRLANRCRLCGCIGHKFFDLCGACTNAIRIIPC
jgi:hypothetical protein